MLFRSEDQARVLSLFKNRVTGDNIPPHAKNADGSLQGILLHADDQDWLRNTRFSVRVSGRLDRRVRRCESTPTYPNNPELRQTNPTTN